MEYKKCTEREIAEKVAELNTKTSNVWVIKDGKLTKTFKFTDFTEAFEFMTKCALYAEKTDHHPEWFNVYNIVKVQLTTHHVSGISGKDFDLAKKMEEICA